MIEIYDITNGKLKCSAYSFWQLCDLLADDYAHFTADEEDDVVRWVEQKARELCHDGKGKDVLERLEHLAGLAETKGRRAVFWRLNLVLGEVLLERGEYESAMGHFEKAVNLLPHNVQALHRLARGLSATGQHQRAADVLRKANGILPSEEAYLALAEVFEKLKGPKEQEKTLRSVLRNYPRSIKGMHMLVRFYRQHGKKAAAARLAQRVVDLSPEPEDRSEPFLPEFNDALIWSKYNYEARKVERVLEFLDEEQGRNPRVWLSLLKAIMLYKLDRRLCREECCCELTKYFRGVGYDKGVVTSSLHEIIDVFGEEFSRGVVRFVKNQFAKNLLRRQSREPTPVTAQQLSSAEGHDQSAFVPGTQNLHLRAKV